MKDCFAASWGAPGTGDVIHLSTLQTWIHESVQADFCDYARTLCGNFPQQLSQRPDGQVPGLDLVFQDQTYGMDCFLNKVRDKQFSNK